jgi:hypothetical protein
MTLTALSGCGPKSTTPAASGHITTSLPSQSISFNSNAAAPQSFTISEAGYSGTFTATSSNANVATITQTSAAATQSSRHVDADTKATFTITPTGGGQATLTISDTIGNSTSITVSVTGATFTPQLQH